MAADMFLDLGEAIKGESQDDKHKDKIDILAWSWGVSNSGSTHMGTGSGTGKASFQDISVTKYVDRASTALIHAVSCGEHIPKAKLTVRKAGKDPLEYLIINLENCLITSYSTGGSGGEERLTENISVNFGKFKISYMIQDATGKGTAAGNADWDIAANKGVVK